MHSDKTFKDDEEFKELLSDYHRIVDAMNDLDEEGEFVDKTDLQNFFEKHNFAKEFSKTWTIYIEKDKINDWISVMNKKFPDRKLLQGNGTQYQTHMDNGTVFTTLYDVSVPKMNIQGKHICLREFVMDVLPEVYKDVCIAPGNMIPDKLEKLPLNARVKLTGETIFTCDVCDKKYVRKTAMKKHMQIKHAQNKIINNIPTKQVTIVPFFPENLRSIQQIGEKEKESTEDDSRETICSLEEIAEIVEEVGPEKVESNWQCGVCGKTYENEEQIKLHISEEHRENQAQDDVRVVALEKELDTLRRRHEQLKAKYEQVLKNDKDNCKKLFEKIKENTNLRDKAKSDAETLADTLSVNQVLMEEIKVKDAIIEANDNLSDTEANKAQESSLEWTNCTKCEWKSKKATQLAGHMLKHTGQYTCPECALVFKTKPELTLHTQEKHEKETIFKCKECDNTYRNETSLKQHMNSKHTKTVNLPIGHADWRRDVRTENQKHQAFACTECGKTFAFIHEIENHVKEHRDEMHHEGFRKNIINRTCRYFNRGYCAKGDQCKFTHKETQQKRTPTCNQGIQCRFLQQNRCRFYHQGVGVQNPQVFRFGMGRSNPPMGIRNMDVWMDY